MNNKVQYSTLILLMFVFMLGLINYVFDMSGWTFVLEFVIVLGLVIFGLMAAVLAYNNLTFGYILSGIVSGIALLNLVAIYFRTDISTLLFLSIVAAITAFVVSVVNIGEQQKQKKVVLKTYTPGKVVASKTGKNYHAPKCEWAKKIKKVNQVWYDSEEAAKKEKLKPHSCLK